MEPVKNQTQSTAVERLSQQSTVQALAVKRFDEASRLLPSRIENTFDLPKVREMVLATDEKTVAGFIEFELIKLAERINVGGNLTPGQVEFIASQLVDAYPNETIADFKICFERGSSGVYGKIWKLDGVEIGNWMKAYLDEKYQVLENELMKEKDHQYKQPIQNTDWLQLWKESIEKTDKEGGVKTTTQNIHFLNNLRGLTDQEIKEQGQEKPKAKFHPTTTPSQAAAHELHLEWIRRNYDKYTGDKLPTWIPEKEWLDSLSQEEKQRIVKPK
jgi:hypothetical protein